MSTDYSRLVLVRQITQREKILSSGATLLSTPCPSFHQSTDVLYSVVNQRAYRTMTQCAVFCGMATLQKQICRCQSVITFSALSGQPYLRSCTSCDVNAAVNSHRADNTHRRFRRHGNDWVRISLTVVSLTEADCLRIDAKVCTDIWICLSENKSRLRRRKCRDTTRAPNNVN